MKLLYKILIATDFSPSSAKVVENAIVLARVLHSSIILVHVLPDDIKNKKARLLLHQAATSQLESINEKIKSEGVETEPPVLEYGSHFDKILQIADHLNVNVIIIGAGEKSKKDVFQLGTTAEKIIRKSVKPVLVLESKKTLHIKNIFCPVDFSPESKRALNSAITIARRFDARLIISSVYEEYFIGSLKLKVNWDEVNENECSEHKNEFESFLKEFNLRDLNWEKEIRKGDPATEILKGIKDYKSDLLILGTTGKSGITRFMMGSVTEKVTRQMPCSFITLKSENVIKLQLETEIRDIESHFNVAMQLIKDGFLEEAINEFKVCLSINDMHLPSLNSIAKVYDKIGKPDIAEEYKNMVKVVREKIWNKKVEIEIRKHFRP